MSFFRRLTIQRLAGIILFVLLFAMAVRVPIDTDTWWHIRSGEYIVEEKAIPKTDLFSHTRYGHEWIDHGWGSQVILYAFYDLFGGDGQPGDSGNIGLALYMAALATLGMGFVYLMCEGNVYIRAFVLVLGASAAAVFWSPRPQMFSFMLGALVLYLLHLYKRERIDRLWFIPLIMIFWVNLHGGFAIGFIFLFGTIGGEIIGNLFNPEDERVVRWNRLKKLLLVTVVSVLAIVVNPHGIKMLSYPFRTVSIGVLQDFIQEWASPNFHERQVWPFALLLLGVLATAGLSSRRIDWTDLALVSGTAFMAMMAGRNIAVFAIAATPVLSRHANTWLTDRGWQIRPMRRVEGTKLVLNWVLLVLIIFAALAKVAVALDRETVREGQETYLPVKVSKFLRENPPEGKMFNSYNWGGYLMFAAPEVPVYVDGRTDLYDDQFLRDYLKIALVREGWEETLEQQNIDFVVIEENGVLAQMLRRQPEKWDIRYEDDQAIVFVRKETGS